MRVLDKREQQRADVTGVRGAMRHPLQAGMLKMVNNWRMVLAFYIAAIAGGAAIFDFVEEGRSFWDGLWWAFITALTIGYGDVYPVTAVGRITGIVLAHVVILVIVPLIIAHMTLKLIRNEHEFTDAEQREMQAKLAATLERAEAAERRLTAVEGQLELVGGNVLALIEHFGLAAVKRALEGPSDTPKELTSG